METKILEALSVTAQVDALMEELKITKGPWTAGWYDTTPTMLQRLQENRQAAIVQHNDNQERGMLIGLCGEFSDEQSRGDAFLMAAAWDMLRANLIAYKELNRYTKEDNPAKSVLREAILKATSHFKPETVQALL